MIFFAVIVTLHLETHTIQCDATSIEYTPGVELEVSCTDRIFADGFES